jgi:hypothetical protein
MYARLRNLDPKSRRLMVAGNFSLAAALLLFSFAHPAAGAARAWFDGLCGLLFGVSIGANLMAIRLRRRCRESRA